MFVESGSARIVETSRTGRDGLAHDAKSGEYWSRDGDKPMVSERRAPVKFVASMPRHLIERLASLSAKFKGKKTPLPVDREITLAEADPWLAGPYRRTFARRFAGRLADPTFRKAVEANVAAYPEWDRILHPEKYPAGAAAPGSQPVGAPPAQGTPPPATKTAPPPPATPPATVPKRQRTHPAIRRHLARREQDLDVKLIWKFNIVLAVIFLFAFAVAAAVAHYLLQANAKEEILRTARLMMEAAGASRDYTTTQIKPLLETQLKYVFLPQTIPAFAATGAVQRASQEA